MPDAGRILETQVKLQNELSRAAGSSASVYEKELAIMKQISVLDVSRLNQATRLLQHLEQNKKMQGDIETQVAKTYQTAKDYVSLIASSNRSGIYDAKAKADIESKILFAKGRGSEALEKSAKAELKFRTDMFKAEAAAAGVPVTKTVAKAYEEKEKGSISYLKHLRDEQKQFGDYSGASKTGLQIMGKEANAFFGSSLKDMATSMVSWGALAGIVMKAIAAFDGLRKIGVSSTRVYTAMGISSEQLAGSTLSSAAEGDRFQNVLLRGINSGQSYIAMQTNLATFVKLTEQAFLESGFGAQGVNKSLSDLDATQITAIRDTALLGNTFQGSLDAGMQFAVKAFQDLNKQGNDLPNLYLRIVNAARNASMNFNEFYKVIQNSQSIMYEMGIGADDLTKKLANVSAAYAEAGAPTTFRQARMGEFLKFMQADFTTMIGQTMAAFGVSSGGALAKITQAMGGPRGEGTMATFRLDTMRQLAQRYNLLPAQGKGFEGAEGVKQLAGIQSMFGMSAFAGIKQGPTFLDMLRGKGTDKNLEELTTNVEAQTNTSLRTMLDQKGILENILDGITRLIQVMVGVASRIGVDTTTMTHRGLAESSYVQDRLAMENSAGVPNAKVSHFRQYKQ